MPTSPLTLSLGKLRNISFHAENIKDHACRFQDYCSKQNERGVENTERDCLDPLRGDIHTHGKMEIRGRREQTHLWQTVREWARDLLSGAGHNPPFNERE